MCSGHIFHGKSPLFYLRHSSSQRPGTTANARSEVLAEGTAEWLSSMEALNPKLIRSVPAYAILFHLGGALRKGSIRRLVGAWCGDPIPYPSMLGADVFVQSLCLGESAKKLRIRLKVKVCQYSCIWGCRADYMGSHMHPTKIPNHLIPIRVQMRRHPYISYISAVIKTLAGCYRILH